jgi:DNA-directed RNA polymerase specialized sigma24 family protein
MGSMQATDEHDRLAERFESERPRLRAVAYRLLGSLAEADDAVQESWLHVSRSDNRSVTHLGRWLTTVVARVCLDMLRSRAARREEFAERQLPDPIISREAGMDPEQEALLAEAAVLFARHVQFARPVLVNGAVGAVVAPAGQRYAVMGFTVRQGKIAAIDILGDPARLRRMGLSALAD